MMNNEKSTNSEEKVIDLLDDFDFGICVDDTSTLLDQLQKSPEVYWKFAKTLEDTKKRVADLRLQLKIKESIIAREARRSAEKMSEARIDRLIYEDLEFINLMEKLNHLKLVEGKLSAFVEGLEQRQNIMLSTLHFMRQELRQHVL